MRTFLVRSLKVDKHVYFVDPNVPIVAQGEVGHWWDQDFVSDWMWYTIKSSWCEPQEVN